jgi:hypothetical protein
MRRIFAPLLLLAPMLLAIGAGAQPAAAQVSIGINAPGFSIGINLPVYPELDVVPGYPVYYAPNVNGDYFFYDGLYWVFNVDDGQWYSSSWYNGPWVYVEPIYVPQPILVIPYRYYRVRPAYWSGWAYDAPPRWGQHWGHDWEARRAGWDRWDRSRVQAPAPLPVYQRNYPRDRYPAPAQQVTIHNEHYKYQGRDPQVQQERAAIFRKQSAGGERATARAERVEHPTAPARGERQQRQETAPPPARSQRPETAQPPAAPRHEAPAVAPAQPERGRRPEPQRAEPQNAAPREQQQHAAPQQAPRREQPAQQAAPQQAPRREQPQHQMAQPPAAPREQHQQAAPQQAPRKEQPPAAPRQEGPAQQAPRGERAPARAPAQQPAVQQQPPAAQHPAKEEHQQQHEEHQQERGNDHKQ